MVNCHVEIFGLRLGKDDDGLQTIRNHKYLISCKLSVNSVVIRKEEWLTYFLEHVHEYDND